MNLNEANREELAQIVGIGDECAERIVRYREQHGQIEDVDELAEELKGFDEEAMRHPREEATV